MRLSWNEIRACAAGFADEWKNARYERGESQTFYNEFFEVFGVTRRRVASFEEPVRRLGNERGFIDLFWKGVLLVEQKSAGRNLIRAKQRRSTTFQVSKNTELPRYVLVSDFQTFELYDLEEDSAVQFSLRDLPSHVENFSLFSVYKGGRSEMKTRSILQRLRSWASSMMSSRLPVMEGTTWIASCAPAILLICR